MDPKVKEQVDAILDCEMNTESYVHLRVLCLIAEQLAKIHDELAYINEHGIRRTGDV